MPYKNWRMHCGCFRDGQCNRWPSPNCYYCGEPGVFDGFYLTAFEAMAAHGKVFGLKPMGYHRPLEQEVMGPLFRRCEVCEGRGTVAIPFEPDWRYCPLCDGLQLVPNVPRAQIAEARRKVLAVYPAAAWPWKE